MHIGSILGQIAMPTLGPYSISKHGKSSDSFIIKQG